MLFLSGIATSLFSIDRQSFAVLKVHFSGLFGMSDAQYGWIVFAFMVPYTIFYLFAGFWIDRFGLRKMFPIFIGGMSIATMLTACSQNLWQIAASRTLLGIAEAGIVPAGVVALVKWIPNERRSSSQSINKPLMLSGQIIATPLTVYLTIHYGWRAAFILPGLLGIVFAIAWGFFDSADNIDDKTHVSEPATKWISIFKQKPIWGLIIARIITDPFWFFMVYWQPAFLQEELGMSFEQMGRMGWIPTAVRLTAGIPLAFYIDHLIGKGKKAPWVRIRTLQIMSFGGLAMWLLMLVTNRFLAIGLLSVIQITSSTWLAFSVVLMADLVPKKILGSAIGIMSGLGAVCSTLFTLVAGYVVHACGYTYIFAACGILYPIAAIILQCYYKRDLASSE
jgi:MFS transporter, ACS family, hexuronate transporter